MALWQGRSRRKPSGGRYRPFRKKRKFEIGREQQFAFIGPQKLKLYRTKGRNQKGYSGRTSMYSGSGGGGGTATILGSGFGSGFGSGRASILGSGRTTTDVRGGGSGSGSGVSYSVKRWMSCIGPGAESCLSPRHSTGTY